MPACGSQLATSNTSPDNEVNMLFNGQCFEKVPCTTAGRKVFKSEKVLHMTISASKRWQQWL
jgi:hypothetical protein